MKTFKTIWFTMAVILFAAGPVLADDGIVERTDVCRKGTIIIKTSDGVYVAAYQESMADEDHSPWSGNQNPPCSFFAGETVKGDLGGVGTVTLTNSSGRECDYVIEGSGDTMQDAEQMLGCE
jgi:hypothetical protein